MREVRKIACIHLNQIGDLLFTFPALHALRQAFPSAHIASVLTSPCIGLLERAHLVDEIIPRPDRSLRTSFRTARLLHRENFDMVVLFSTAESSWIIAQLSGARLKVGFTESMGGRLLSTSVPWSPPPSTTNNLRMMEAIGCKPTRADYTGFLALTSEDRNLAESVLGDAGISPVEEFVVISQGTSKGRELKSWTNEGFAEVADELMRRYGLKSVAVGLDGGEKISALSSSVVDLTGRTSLTTLAAVIERAKLFIGIDSGVMHLSAAIGKPVIGLFGPSDPELTGPQGTGHRILRAGLDCSPCFRKECEKEAACMRSIRTDHVLAAFSFIMQAETA